MNVNGVVTERLIQQSDIQWFKQIFGNDLDLVRIKGKYKYGVNSCGWCVRDLLLENVPFYINLALTASVTEIKECLKEAFAGKLKRKTELRHGLPFQCVKTLSCDVNVIRVNVPHDPSIPVTIHWKLSQTRRVFSISAVLLGFDDKVFNYFNTHSELLKVLGETESRIKADYLRILRYFRIFGRIANDDSLPDERTLNAVKINISGLDTIKGEQIWNELRMILIQPCRVKLVETIFECGGFKHMGLPENADFKEFKNVSENSIAFEQYPLLAVTYLCTFIKSSDEMVHIHQRLKLSTYERDLAYFLMLHRNETRNIEDLGYYQRMCLQPIKGNKSLAKEYVLELLKLHNRLELFSELMLWT